MPAIKLVRRHAELAVDSLVANGSLGQVNIVTFEPCFFYVPYPCHHVAGFQDELVFLVQVLRLACDLQLLVFGLLLLDEEADP